MALDLLVNIYKVDINRLYFTYFGGDASLKLEPDLETKNIWIKLGIDKLKVLPFGMKENFWEMDHVGPCGPCTEIHYDRSAGHGSSIEDARQLVNAGTEQVIELWNIVFMQYNRLNKAEFTRLPDLVVDTGMGLERLAAILNNFDSNYSTDLFLPLFSKIHSFCEPSGRISMYDESDQTNSKAILSGYRIIADHMRSISVSISDGLLPSRNGLGGFLKYLILKNMRISKEVFGIENSSELLCQLVPIVVDSLKDAYPEISNKTAYIQQV